MTDPAGGPLRGLTAWALTEGHVGMEVQVTALARGLGLDPEVKRVAAPPWGWLPANLWPAPLAFARHEGARLAPPWPDILITCGRRSVAIALAIRRESRRVAGDGSGTFTIHIQDPKIDPGRLDLVIAPSHDGLTGANVITCLGSIHDITPEAVSADAGRLAPRFSGLARPLIAVMVGGPTGAYRVGAAEMEALGTQLRALTGANGCGLAVTPSRRTGAANTEVLSRALAGTGAVIWDGAEPNPYRALLGLADGYVVTCDSVNMICEAAATGRPVYVAMFEGRSARFDAFHEEMRRRGHVRPFAGTFDAAWRPVPLRELERICGEIAARYAAARTRSPGRGASQARHGGE